MNKYRVLLVSPFPPPFGGIASYSENLYNGLLKKNEEVRKYNTSKYDHLRFHNPDKKRNYMRIFHLWNILFLSLIIFDYILFIFHIILKRNLIVHIHTSSFFGWWRSTLYILIARIMGKKTILHVHNAIDRFYLEESGQLGKFFIRISLRIPHHIVSLSHGIKNLLVKLTKNLCCLFGSEDAKFQNAIIYCSP